MSSPRPESSSKAPVVAVLGGCGHVGFPLALTFAESGCRAIIVDRDEVAVRAVQEGRIPFVEQGAQELLSAHLGRDLSATTDPRAVAEADAVICVVGTPIDAHLNPQISELLTALDEIRPHLRAGQLLVLRSTVFPGATRHVARWAEREVPGLLLATCPERVAQGASIVEIRALPQIVSGTTPEALARARDLFGRVASSVLELEPAEAELAKLFCNAWRYASFAIANQFYELCVQAGVDYYRVRDAVRLDYPRMSGLPGAGFAAGPCLLKDTVQLAAFFNNQFSIGQVAMLVNEGLPRFLVDSLREKVDLRGQVVGILGMAFKGDSDDTRDSLAYKLKKLLTLECKEVLCTDELVRDDRLVPLDEVLERADLVVIGAPHSRYRSLKLRQPVLDPWNVLGRGGLFA